MPIIVGIEYGQEVARRELETEQKAINEAYAEQRKRYAQDAKEIVAEYKKVIAEREAERARQEALRASQPEVVVQTENFTFASWDTQSKTYILVSDSGKVLQISPSDPKIVNNQITDKEIYTIRYVAIKGDIQQALSFSRQPKPQEVSVEEIIGQ